MRNADWIDGRFVMAMRPGAHARLRLPARLALGRGGAAHRARRRRRARPRAPAAAHAPRREARERARVRRRPRGDHRLRRVALHAAPSRAATPRREPWATWRPEQAYGKPTLASDVFSLGLIAYELLTGKLLDLAVHLAARALRPLPRQGARAAAARAAEGVRVRSRRPLPARRSSSTTRSRRRFAARSRPSATRRRRAGAQQRVTGPTPTPFAVGMELFRRRARPRARPALPLPPLQRPDRRGDERVPVVRQRGQLVQGDHERAARSAATASAACCRSGPPARGVTRAASRATAARRAPIRRRPAPLRAARLPGPAAPFMRYCPVCKRKPGRPWSHADLPERCPRCRWPTSQRLLPLLRLVRPAPARE